MARTLIEVYLHIVFSTKHRANVNHPEIENDEEIVSPLEENGVAGDARLLWDCGCDRYRSRCCNAQPPVSGSAMHATNDQSANG